MSMSVEAQCIHQIYRTIFDVENELSFRFSLWKYSDVFCVVKLAAVISLERTICLNLRQKFPWKWRKTRLRHGSKYFPPRVHTHTHTAKTLICAIIFSYIITFCRWRNADDEEEKKTKKLFRSSFYSIIYIQQWHHTLWYTYFVGWMYLLIIFLIGKKSTMPAANWSFY